MRTRTLVAVATALVTFGLTFGATASPTPRAERPAPAPATLGGQVVDWNPAVPSLTIEDPDVIGGSRGVRRMLRALDEVPLAIGTRTRIVAEDDDGARERIDADVLFAELDDSEEMLSVTVVASVVRRAGRREGVAPGVSAKRVVLHLPASAEDDGELGDEEPDLADGDSDSGDPPPGDEG